MYTHVMYISVFVRKLEIKKKNQKIPKIRNSAIFDRNFITSLAYAQVTRYTNKRNNNIHFTNDMHVLFTITNKK